MNRVFNFSAGPAMLPTDVITIMQEELLDYHHTGMSVLELSHRSDLFNKIIEGAKIKLRRLMQIPDEYEVLFFQGGASLQFTMVPMNLMTLNKSAGYIDTGVWSEKSIVEARKFGRVKVIASSKDKDYHTIPDYQFEDGDRRLDYLHITTNNTINGTCYAQLPELNPVPLVADMSSDILSKPYDVAQFGLIYAGAQKNLGIPGLAVVIIRSELLQRSLDTLPSLLSYKTSAAHHSLYHTPNTFAIYVCNLVLDWLEKMGGVSAIYKINMQKAALFYQYLDQSELFHTLVSPPYRSIMNIPFYTNDIDTDRLFIESATRAGFTQLKGHRTVGGMRASMYNAMPLEGVKALVDFMRTFEQNVI